MIFNFYVKKPENQLASLKLEYLCAARTSVLSGWNPLDEAATRSRDSPALWKALLSDCSQATSPYQHCAAIYVQYLASDEAGMFGA